MINSTEHADIQFRLLIAINKAAGVTPILQDIDASPLAESIYRRLSETLTWAQKEQLIDLRPNSLAELSDAVRHILDTSNKEKEKGNNEPSTNS